MKTIEVNLEQLILEALTFKGIKVTKEDVNFLLEDKIMKLMSNPEFFEIMMLKKGYSKVILEKVEDKKEDDVSNRLNRIEATQEEILKTLKYTTQKTPKEPVKQTKSDSEQIKNIEKRVVEMIQTIDDAIGKQTQKEPVKQNNEPFNINPRIISMLSEAMGRGQAKNQDTEQKTNRKPYPKLSFEHLDIGDVVGISFSPVSKQEEPSNIEDIIKTLRHVAANKSQQDIVDGLQSVQFVSANDLKTILKQ